MPGFFIVRQRRRLPLRANVRAKHVQIERQYGAVQGGLEVPPPMVFHWRRLFVMVELGGFEPPSSLDFLRFSERFVRLPCDSGRRGKNTMLQGDSD